MSVRTRFAPSPTGYLHIGGVRTALFNWAFARRHGGQFILRIDDTDEQRHVEEAVQLILDGFRWMGMDWNEGPEIGGPYGPYFQSQRTHLYHAALEQLISNGFAYPCLATEKELTAARELARASKTPFVYRGPTRDMSADEALSLWREQKPALRFKVEPGKVTKIQDHVRGDVEWQTDLLGDFTIARSGGHPLYNFASVVDDLGMKITHVIRAEEHLSNTHPQVLIFEALGGPLPEFAHVPYVAEPGSSKKLSKRNPPPGVMVGLHEYRDAGYLPEGMFNGLARLGWSLDDRTEVMSRETVVSHFSLDRITKAPASLDMDKLFWIQDQQMQLLSAEERLERAIPILIASELIGDSFPAERRKKVVALIAAAGDRIKLTTDVGRYCQFLLVPQLDYEAKSIKSLTAPNAAEHLGRIRETLSSLEPFDASNIESAIKKLGAELGIGGKINHLLRGATTGRSVGAGVFDCVAILGKQSALAHIDQTLGHVSTGKFPEAK